ncbi:MAG: TonB-dependent receptor [Kangiellaceae bacterium]|nr:TonB-dependent receptor [Kangiellaceae bacterium]
MKKTKLSSTTRLFLISSFVSTSLTVWADDAERDYFDLSLKELANIKVVTSSKREQTVNESYANINVITKQMIESRGYRNVIEVLEDLPGFDFATYEDGGGEYPVHFLNRGIGGDNGNSRLLVMVDGFVQNHISFNWSQGLTDEQMLHDVERIEVVQGPGSSLYGAQAVSGIVHIITRSGFEGTQAKLTVGENSSRTMELLYGKMLGTAHFQLAMKAHKSDGDFGKGRPDPAGYFTNNVHPDILTANYDDQGNYVTNVPNPLAGQPIPDGFNNSKDDTAIRLKVTTDTLELGVNYWNKKDGLGSYVVGYEYDATGSDFITHHSATTVYVKNTSELVEDKLNWKADLWYRLDNQESDTGFRYLYRFNQLKKSYHSASSQIGFENQFDWQLSQDKTVILGARVLGNRQTEQVISLGQLQSGNESTTNSSWDIAVAGNGLNQEKVHEIFDETETAFYALLEGEFNDKLSYSIGSRYSNGSDYGSTNNPRAGLIYLPSDKWTLKALYGSAFRQPSLFELRDEFRGSEDLAPEEIDTYELEASYQFSNHSKFKVNLFHSELKDSINLIPDLSRAGGERYANVDSSKSRGISTQLDMQPTDNITLFANYIFQQGKMTGGSWGELTHTAEHKLNLGINWQPYEYDLNINLRANIVGDRKTPDSNQYFNGHADGYNKVDLVVAWTEIFDVAGLNTQFIFNNLFDESYFGVGRQAGSSLPSDYDPLTNPDPIGFIPAYHPQPGRTFHWSISYKL